MIGSLSKPWQGLSQRLVTEGGLLEVCRGQDKFPRGQRSSKGFQFRFRDRAILRLAW